MTLVGNPAHGDDTIPSTKVTPIELARAYVQNQVQVPALASALPEAVKGKIRHSDFWLKKFTRVGDLLIFLMRFEIDRNDPVYIEMKRFGLLTFEDIVSDFKKKFAQWATDCSRTTDFVIGAQYSVYDILILARNYDTRSGGMFVLEAGGVPAVVVIKANLADGPYPNEWIDEPRTLKYYLKSISGKFGEHFAANRAIIENKSIPILTFTRTSKIDPFIFRGIFRYQDILREVDGRKSFILARDIVAEEKIYANSLYVEQTLELSVSNSLKDSRDARLKRLAAARKFSKRIVVTSIAFDRNPDVIAEVLYRASGVCESCAQPAPFFRLSNGTPYLEVHHRVPLSNGGADTVTNAIALCPNCHRRTHYGPEEAFKPNSSNDDDLIVTI